MERSDRPLKFTIYCHIHRESSRRYVGQTKKTMLQRWNQHVYTSSQAKKKGWSYFANAIRKYGKDAFDHEVLEVCFSEAEANAAEDKWIERFNTRDPLFGFNILKGGCRAERPAGNPWDRPDYAAKVSSSMALKWQDPEYRAALTASSREVNSRPEVKKKIGDAARGREMTPDQCRAISDRMKGRRHPQEVLDRIAESNRNRSEESRRRSSEAASSAWADPESRARRIASNRSSDPAVRAKIAESLRRRHSSMPARSDGSVAR